jgi:hypothetical protein
MHLMGGTCATRNDAGDTRLDDFHATGSDESPRSLVFIPRVALHDPMSEGNRSFPSYNGDRQSSRS